jgi:hypothetical protein
MRQWILPSRPQQRGCDKVNEYNRSAQAGRTCTMHEIGGHSEPATPLMLGVSGHRDLKHDGIALLREAVAQFVDEVRALLPDTPLRILVGMADGADLLVAQTAIELGVQVEAMLPMSLKDYAADFDAATFARLEALLAHPHVRCIELASPRPKMGVPPSSAAQMRDLQYANLTAALIRRSSLLLAVWDGQGSTLPGGTADTVLRYLGARTDDNRNDVGIKFVPAEKEFETAEHLVYWIPVVRRTGDADPIGPVREPCYLMGVGDNLVYYWSTMPSQLRSQLAGINQYNRDARELESREQLPHVESLLLGLPSDLGTGKDPQLAAINHEFGKSDALARYYQKYSDRLFGIFGVMTVTLGLAYLIYEKFTKSRVLLAVYMGVLLSSLLLYYLLAGRRWFAKHLSYRALAETMRAKFYLRLAGAESRVDAAELLTLSGIDRFHGFGWIGYALKGVEPADIGATPEQEPLLAPSLQVEQGWIESQHRYLSSKVARMERSSRRIGWLKRGVFIAILGVTIALFFLDPVVRELDVGFGVPLHNLLTFCMGFFAVVLGAWTLHQDKMATSELLWQYRNLLSHFASARLQLQHTRSAERRAEVLAALGKDSLMECYLWTIHRYHREHEPPSA